MSSSNQQLSDFMYCKRHFETELKKNVFTQLEDRKRVASENEPFQRAISLLDMEPNEVGQLCHSFKDGELVRGCL